MPNRDASRASECGEKLDVVFLLEACCHGGHNAADNGYCNKYPIQKCRNRDRLPTLVVHGE